MKKIFTIAFIFCTLLASAQTCPEVDLKLKQMECKQNLISGGESMIIVGILFSGFAALTLDSKDQYWGDQLSFFVVGTASMTAGITLYSFGKKPPKVPKPAY
jgi:hypothetical protein